MHKRISLEKEIYIYLTSGINNNSTGITFIQSIDLCHVSKKIGKYSIQRQFYSSSCKNARYILQIAAWVLKQEVQHIFSHTKESTVQKK